jgi:hypothetical protein
MQVSTIAFSIAAVLLSAAVVEAATINRRYTKSKLNQFTGTVW